MKLVKALIPLFLFRPANIQTWVLLIIFVSAGGWKGLAIFYIIGLITVWGCLAVDPQTRKKFIQNEKLAKEDWLVKFFCALGFHIWGEINIEEPKSERAKLWLRHGSKYEKRVGKTVFSCCGKEQALDSFVACDKENTREPIWFTMDSEEYEEYQKAQDESLCL